MKKLFLAFFVIFFFNSAGFSQNNFVKDYPLKDYVAPEIRYRLMDLGTRLNFNGNNNFDNNNAQNNFSGNLILYYYEYLNLAKVQRIEDAGFATNYSSVWNKDDTIHSLHNRSLVNMTYLTQTRFYHRNNRFWGVHGNMSYYLSPGTTKETSEENVKMLDQRFTITPYFSYGKGRIQPVESARQALDILRSLKKHNRLAVLPGKSMIDSLARVANRITYKRFFDSRFKTIYQLEELDKALQDMGLVDTVDMIYFANLNDIWNYALTFKRGSGTRFEGGLIPLFSTNLSKTDDPNASEKTKYNRMNYGAYGFFSFDRMRPISYTWQSDLMIDLTFGYDKSVSKNETDDGTDKNENSYFRSMLNAGWQFGFFPNTRTYAGITPYTGLTYTMEKDGDNTFGMNTGFLFNAYYYISPRLRLNFRAGFYYVNSFDTNIPTPFWNTVAYTNQDIYKLTKTNDNIPFPVNAGTGLQHGIKYDFLFSLRYALF